MRPLGWVVLLWLIYALELAVGLFADGLSAWERGLILLVGLILSAIVYYQEVYRPTIQIENHYLGIVLADLFGALSAKYRERHPGEYELRLNLMRVRRRRFFGDAYLRIDFWLGHYTDAELEQTYESGKGCAGAALEQAIPSIYDSIRAHEHRLGLTATQRQVTAQVHSILSTPVFRPKPMGRRQPIAVLNLDSTDPIAKTGLDEPEPRELILYYAKTIGAITR